MDLGLKNKLHLASLLAFVAALFLGLLVSFLYETSASAGRVVRGVEWGEESVAGLDKEALRKRLKSRDDATRQTQVELVLGKENKSFSAGDLGISLDAEGALRSALSAGRGNSSVGRFGFWFGRLFSVHQIRPRLSLDQHRLKKSVQAWAKTLLKEPELPSLSYEKELVVVVGRGGTVIEYGALGSALRKALLAKRSSHPGDGPRTKLNVPTKERPPAIPSALVDTVVEQAHALLSGPISIKAPEGTTEAILSPTVVGAALSSEVDEEQSRLRLTLDVSLLRKAIKGFLKEWERPAVEAGFQFPGGAAPIISASEEGRGLDEEALKTALLQVKSEGPRQIVLPLEEKRPRLTTLEAEKLGVKGLVMSFTTRHACCQSRVENIHQAAEQLDGVVLRPGEKFSLNDFLGPRRRSSGYHKAPTIVRGEMEDVYGGGISQLATTLFNAVLRGGYEIIQRQPHSVYFPRYPEGHEATVSFPEPDLIFRNDTEAGMVIKTNAAPTYITVLVYGDNEGRVTTVDKGRRYNIVQPPKEYEPDEAMPPEKFKRLRAGQLGWTILVSRKVKYPDGKEKVEKREVVYNARPELLRVHPCMIPEGEEGHTAEKCPEPEIHEEEEELAEDVYFETQ